MSKAPRGARVEGRRNCTRCGRWRHALDFRARARDPETGEALRLQYHCNSCHRAEVKEYNKQPKIQKRNRKLKRAWYRQKIGRHKTIGEHPRSQSLRGKNNTVHRIPIARLLRKHLRRHGYEMRALAREIDVDEKRLYSIMYGYTRDQRKKKGRPLKGTRLAPVDYIDISTVDRWLQALGYPASKLDELYPIDTSVD